MEQKYQMSYFEAPITNTRPCRTLSVLQVYEMITGNEGNLFELTREVRRAADFETAKKTRLPFVTPCGTFELRRKDKWIDLSGLLPIDIDDLASRAEAEQVRDLLAGDPYLKPVLTFVSPSGLGVKAFVPYSMHYHGSDYSGDNARRMDEHIHETAMRYAMNYTNAVYGTCDGSGKDLSRSCFLCYDERAKLNLQVTNI